MTWLKLLPTWCWWLLGVLLVGVGQQLRVSGAQADAAEAKTMLSDYHLLISERDRRAEAQARNEEQRRQQAVDEVEKDAKGKLDEARADADRAGDALQRLQQRYEDAERRSRTCGNAVTAQLGEAAEAGARMRADVLSRIGKAARFYAAEADERGVAGRACEAAYSALTR